MNKYFSSDAEEQNMTDQPLQRGLNGRQWIAWPPSRRTLLLVLAALSFVFAGLMAMGIAQSHSDQAKPAQTAPSMSAQSDLQHQAAVIAEARQKISANVLLFVSASPPNRPSTADTVKAAANDVTTTLQTEKSPALDTQLQAQLDKATNWADLSSIDATLAAKGQDLANKEINLAPAAATPPQTVSQHTAPTWIQYVLIGTALLILILAVYIAFTDNPNFAETNPMPSASQYKEISDKLRTKESYISTVGTKVAAIKQYLLECQSILDPIETRISQNDRTALNNLRIEASNPSKDSSDLATRCRKTLDNIIAQIEQEAKRQEGFERMAGGWSSGTSQRSGATGDSGTRSGGSPSPVSALPGEVTGGYSPAPSRSEAEALKQVTTLQGFLKQREDQISQLNGRIGEIQSVKQGWEAERTRLETTLSGLKQQITALQAEKSSLQGQLQGQIDRLTAKVTAQDETRQQAERQFQQQLAQVKAASEQAARAATENQAVLSRKHEETRKSLEEAQKKLQGREDAGVALRELVQASPGLPKELAEFVEKLSEIDVQVAQGNSDWVEKNLTEVDRYVYQSPPPSARLSGRYPQFDEPIRLHQIGLVQRSIHQQMSRLGFGVIDPLAGTPFDSRLHESDEQNLIWVTSPEKHNQIVSVVRPGFQREGRVLKQAQVKKHVYFQGGGRAGATEAATSAPPVELDAKEAVSSADFAGVESVTLTETASSAPVETRDAAETLPEAILAAPALPREEMTAAPASAAFPEPDLAGQPESLVEKQVETPPVMETVPPPVDAVVEDTPEPSLPITTMPEYVVAAPEQPEKEPAPESAIAVTVVAAPRKERKPGGGSSLEEKLARMEREAKEAKVDSNEE